MALFFATLVAICLTSTNSLPWKEERKQLDEAEFPTRFNRIYHIDLSKLEFNKEGFVLQKKVSPNMKPAKIQKIKKEIEKLQNMKSEVEELFITKEDPLEQMHICAALTYYLAYDKFEYESNEITYHILQESNREETTFFLRDYDKDLDLGSLRVEDLEDKTVEDLKQGFRKAMKELVKDESVQNFFGEFRFYEEGMNWFFEDSCDLLDLPSTKIFVRFKEKKDDINQKPRKQKDIKKEIVRARLKLKLRQRESMGDDPSTQTVLGKVKEEEEEEVKKGKSRRKRNKKKCSEKETAEVVEEEKEENVEDGDELESLTSVHPSVDTTDNTEFSPLEELKDIDRDMSNHLHALNEDLGRRRSVLDQGLKENEELKNELKEARDEINRLNEEKKALERNEETRISLKEKNEKLVIDIKRIKEKNAENFGKKNIEIENLKKAIEDRERMLRLFEAERMEAEDFGNHEETEPLKIPLSSERWDYQTSAGRLLPIYWSRKEQNWLASIPTWDDNDKTLKLVPFWTELGEDFYSNPMNLRMF